MQSNDGMKYIVRREITINNNILLLQSKYIYLLILVKLSLNASFSQYLLRNKSQCKPLTSLY